MKSQFFALFVLVCHFVSGSENTTAKAPEKIIALGTTNRVKFESLRSVIGDYDFLRGAIIVPLSVPSNVSPQPKTLEETIRGAMGRAKNAFRNCDLSVGIESGIMKLRLNEWGKPKDAYFDITACSIYDGTNHRLGFSCSFQLPDKVTHEIDKGEDLGNAMRLSGLTSKFEIGKEEGSIGVLTSGRVNRQDYTEQAIRMAFIPIVRCCDYAVNGVEHSGYCSNNYASHVGK